MQIQKAVKRDNLLYIVRKSILKVFKEEILITSKRWDGLIWLEIILIQFNTISVILDLFFSFKYLSKNWAILRSKQSQKENSTQTVHSGQILRKT